GVFAYITDAEAKDWQSSIDIVLRRFTEYHDLEGAFGRRAVIERAKGILMERHSIDDRSAFEMLRDQARGRGLRDRRRPRPPAKESAGRLKRYQAPERPCCLARLRRALSKAIRATRPAGFEPATSASGGPIRLYRRLRLTGV